MPLPSEPQEIEELIEQQSAEEQDQQMIFKEEESMIYEGKRVDLQAEKQLHPELA